MADPLRSRVCAYVALSLTSLAAGCGPSLSSLIARRHYTEAFCAASEKGGLAYETVQRAADADLALRVNVRGVTRAELDQAAPGLAPPVAARAVILRYWVRHNVIALEPLSTSIRLVQSERALPSVSHDYAALAAFTEELVPRGHVVRPSGVTEAVYGVASSAHEFARGGAWVLSVATLGILNFSRLLGSGPRAPTSTYVPPSRADLERSIPNALRLSIALRDTDAHCSAERPDCVTWALLPRPADEATAPLAIELDITYLDTSGCRNERARWRRRVRMTLPPGPTVEDRVRALFGNDLRAPSELPEVAAQR